MTEKANGNGKWGPREWTALAVAVLTVVGMVIAAEARFVRLEQYRVDQSRTDRALERIEDKLDELKDDVAEMRRK